MSPKEEGDVKVSASDAPIIMSSQRALIKSRSSRSSERPPIFGKPKTFSVLNAIISTSDVFKRLKIITLRLYLTFLKKGMLSSCADITTPFEFLHTETQILYGARNAEIRIKLKIPSKEKRKSKEDSRNNRRLKRNSLRRLTKKCSKKKQSLQMRKPLMLALKLKKWLRNMLKRSAGLISSQRYTISSKSS